MKNRRLLSICKRVLTVASLAMLSGVVRLSGENLTGTVTEQGVGTPIPNAVVTIVQLGSSAVTNASGQYAFGELPGGTTYTVTAQAAGFITDTKTVWIGGAANQPPVVTLTSPVDGSTYTAPATIVLAATATDPDGTVVSVRFYRGTTLLNTDTASPYSYNWTGVAAGSYALRAVAQDNWGATSTSTIVTVTVASSGTPNQAPQVTLTSPVNGSTYTAPATVNLAATATDPDGSVARVEFWRGATLLNADTSSPYAYSWTNVGVGTYALRAIAYDNVGATSTSTVSTVTVIAAQNQPPVVTLTSPVTGSTYTAPASIPFAATASDPDGSIANVRFYNGTTMLITINISPYTYTWTGVSSGTYNVRAVATDNAGATSTSTVATITVYPSGTPPVWYTLTTTANPAAGGSVSPAGSTQYLAGSQVTVTATPNANYVFANWTGDATGTDPTITITMDSDKSITANFTYVPPANQAPQVTLTSPVTGSTFTAPATISLAATATDPDGTVAQVQFFANGVLIGTDSSAPYSVTWAGVSAGTYQLTAVATDDQGATGTSTAVSITVNTAPVVPPANVPAPGEVRIGGSVEGYFNPLVGPAQITFTLKTAGTVKVRVYSLRGQLVWEDAISGGANETRTRLWNGTDTSNAAVASGVYIVQVNGGGIDKRIKCAVVAQ